MLVVLYKSKSGMLIHVICGIVKYILIWEVSGLMYLF